MNKKRVIIVAGIIILIVLTIIFIIVNSKKNKNLDYQLEEVKEINYFTCMEDNKYGVIDKSGKNLVPAVYDEIQIPNPSKPLFICMYDYDAEKGQYKIKVFNDKSEQILYQYIVVEAINLNSGLSAIPYEKSVLKYKDKDKFGLIDFDGKVIVKAKYDEIQSFEYNEGLLLVKKNNKFGIININGATVVEEKFDKIESDSYYEEGANYRKSGYIVAQKNGEIYKYGFINCKGKKLLDTKYEQIGRIRNNDKNDDIYLVAVENGKASFYKNDKKIINSDYDDIGYDENNNCLILENNGKQGLSDMSGNITLEMKYDNIYISGKYINAQNGKEIDIFDYSTKQKISFENVVGINQTSNDRYSIAIMENEKFRIIDNENNELKNQEYESLEHLYDNYFSTLKKGKFGIIDEDGNKVIDYKYDYIQKIPNTKVIQAVNKNKNTIDLITNDTVITSMPNAQIQIMQNYIVMESQNDRKYIDFEGNFIENKAVLNKSLFAKRKGLKWGFVNKDDEYVIEAKYDFVTEFNRNGFAGIKKDGKWGAINQNGEVVVEPKYQIESNNPSFIGEYYEKNVMYGESYYVKE